MTQPRRTGKGGALILLVVAAVAAAGCVLSWLAARSAVEIAAVIDGEQPTTGEIYSPALLGLAFLLATVAGVATVLAVAKLRRRP